ncbi:hypothetical protein CDLVIII_4941 [Clostridium sp. DL-VIII]|uniref:hypothetical protein n=1 Tax=Clostridium sp. DL-VIII TaxID=641107 RepID=UPI00023B055B|nr:hypothetical protein [Clostridium sp. DL-VIII]EHJ01432.1 hypothetical protein CDLVIII_4941 [Clostridium sp. DL-VIII]
MNTNNEIIKAINNSLLKNLEFEFIAKLEDLTLSDIDDIEKMSNVNNKYNLTYQIIDNIYIKIYYSLQSVC